MDVHLRDLRYFAMVAEHLHFTRAAEALFISQPALSKQIRTLEAELRVALFERDRRKVRLTPAGAALLPQARAILDAWLQAEKTMAAVAAEQTATLVVGMSTGPGRGLLPAARARFTAAAPSAQLRLRHVSWDDPTAGLASEGEDRTDAAFVWLPLPSPDSYEWLIVATEPCLVALPATHRLAGQDSVDIADLLDEPFLALPRSSPELREYWLAVEARDGHTPVIGAEVANAEETVEALTAGLGVCLIAAGNAPLVTRDGITTRPVTGIPPSTLVLAWRRGDRRPLLHSLVNAVRQAATEAALPERVAVDG